MKFYFCRFNSFVNFTFTNGLFSNPFKLSKKERRLIKLRKCLKFLQFHRVAYTQDHLSVQTEARVLCLPSAWWHHLPLSLLIILVANNSWQKIYVSSHKYQSTVMCIAVPVKLGRSGVLYLCMYTFVQCFFKNKFLQSSFGRLKISAPLLVKLDVL